MKEHKKDPATPRPLIILPATSMLPTWRTIDRILVERLSKWDIPFSAAAATIHLYVNPEDAEPARLAEAIFIPRQSMTFTLDTLERLGLATRTPHPEDRRKKNILLSEKGEALGKTMLDDLLQFEASVLAVFSADERIRLQTLSLKLADTMTHLNQ